MPPSCTSVILAAGHNTRLRGIVPTAFKPLIVVNGEPIISNLVRQSVRQHAANPPVVVVSPMNVQPIAELVGGEVFMVVQPVPSGPVCALFYGMRAVDSEYVVILCGDNVVPPETMGRITRMARGDGMCASVTPLHGSAAQRFTRLSPEGRFVESVVHCEEEDDHVCWIGPVILPAASLRRAFTVLVDEDADLSRTSFAKLFNVCVQHCGLVVATIAGGVQDIGVPEEMGA